MVEATEVPRGLTEDLVKTYRRRVHPMRGPKIKNSIVNSIGKS